MVNFKIEELEKYYDPFHTYRLFKDFKESIFLDSSKDENGSFDSIFSLFM